MSNVKKENNYYSWSAQLARDFGAQYTAQAISGIGVMDHVDSKTAKSPAMLSLARYIGNSQVIQSRAPEYGQGDVIVL